MKVTVLGCGTSGGVPRVGEQNGGWGECDPAEPKNRRRRVSVLVEEQGADGRLWRILIDTSPDLREQLLSANVTSLDAVFLTHDHADHTHGIDDLRAVCHIMRRRIPMYMDGPTAATMKARFGYVFAGQGDYPALCDLRLIKGDVAIGPLTVKPFEQQHGAILSLGFRIRDFAYSTDLNGIPPHSEPFLQNLDCWLVDALRRSPHPSHPHLDMTLGWINTYRPRRAVLTHMDWSMDYATLIGELPPGIEPGYDGMVLDL